jgi:small GTP-binding protein
LGVRIFSLAKELNMTSKELMAYLETQGHSVKNHMCTIPDQVAQILRDRLPKRVVKAAAPKPKVINGGLTTGAGPSTAAVSAPKPSIVGKAKPVVPAVPAAARLSAAPPPVAPPPAAEEEAPEKDKDEKRAKGGKETHPTRKRVFPGSPDFGMDVLGTRLAGTRRGIRRIEPARSPRDGGGAAAATAQPKVVNISPPITLKDLSAAIGVKANMIIGSLMQKGQMPTMNSYLRDEDIETISREFGVEVAVKREMDLEEELKALENYVSPPEKLLPRAPVVTFMGHVDHGKTSLLDKIRKTKVTQSESGGITQHLGAYRVDQGDVHVVFIDTPGHKAFTEMRARGANITDVAVLVVAADDGPMPQTEEAINHANAAGVPIVVALNKIDKPNINLGRCRDLLAKLNLIPVEWGGKTEFVEVSAMTSQGIDDLLQVVSLESQILDLKADPSRPAIGTVLEAESNTGRGIIATVLVQDGTLRPGDYVLCGPAHGRVRGLWLNGVTPVSEALP